MRRHYSQQRDALLHSLQETFPGQHEVLGDASGLHVVVRFQGVAFTKQLVRSICDAGVRVYAVSKLSIEEKEPDGLLVMGYSALSPDEIREGVSIIRQMLR